MKSDLDLSRDVLARLELEPKIDLTELGVSVDHGVVTLRGTVGSEAERVSAERALRILDGVKGLLDDDLKVDAALCARPTDGQVAAAVEEAIRWLTTVPQEGIKTRVLDGWVGLDGEVESKHQFRTVEEVVCQVPGVRGVRNGLAVRADREAA